MTENKIIWHAKPSQWLNFMIFFLATLLCFLIAPIFVAIWAYLVLKNEEYDLTKNTLTLHSGVLNKKIDDIELYRVKDISLEQPLILRLVGLGNIYLITSDQTNQHVALRGIKNSKELRTQLRELVEAARKERGVRELDTF